MRKWNYVAMGQIGLSGITAKVARPLASSISRRTGRPEGQVLALIGAGFLAISLIDFLRTVDAGSLNYREVPPSATPLGRQSVARSCRVADTSGCSPGCRSGQRRCPRR
jgi:hypothetical protein